MLPTALDPGPHATSVALLVDLAAERGVPEAVCLRGTGLSRRHLDDPVVEVDARDERTVMANLVAALGDPPGLGIEAGRRYHLTAHGIWGYALVASPTLGSALEVGMRYRELTASACRVDAEVDGDRLALVFDPAGVDEAIRRFVLERELSGVATLFAEVVGRAVPLLDAEVALPEPDDPAPYVGLFGTMPRFGARRTLASIPVAALGARLPQANERTARACEEQCRRLLEARRSRTGTAGEVRRLLVARPGVFPGIEDVAARLCVSERTLRRRLDAEGTSYRALLDEVRQALAEELLAAGDLTVEEAARRLGYAEAASFVHAFKRWTGVAPTRWRAALPGPGVPRPLAARIS